MTTYAPNTKFGKYRILRLLGQGGMADVYEAEETTVGRIVALKVLPAAFARDEERAGRFAKEIQASAKLHHPNIVSVFEVGEVDGLHYYTMSVLPGGDLKDRLKNGALPPKDALRIAREIAGALAYAHDNGFVHRDVKPENILFREDGSAVLTDFGIARATVGGTRMTATGLSIGTPHYMSPEQARGREVDGRSDLYALGVVLYEMLTGQVPFDSTDSLAIGIMHLQDPVPPLPKELAEYQPVLDRLLAKDPEQRYPTGNEIADDLDRLDKGEPITHTGESATSQRIDASEAAGLHRLTNQIQRMNKSVLWGIAGACAAVLFIVAFFYQEEYAPSSESPSGLTGGSVLDVSSNRTATRAPADSPQQRADVGDQLANELAAQQGWENASATDTSDAYEAFLQVYPDSEYRDEARARLEDLQRAQEIKQSKVDDSNNVVDIEHEMARLGLNVVSDGSLDEKESQYIQFLEAALGLPVKGEPSAEILDLLKNRNAWPTEDIRGNAVGFWQAGDITTEDTLRSATLISGVEDVGFFDVVKALREEITLDDETYSFVVLVHGNEGRYDGARTRSDLKLVTVAIETQSGLKIAYKRRFAYSRDAVYRSDRDLDVFYLSNVSLMGSLIKIQYAGAEGNTNWRADDLLSFTTSGELVEVTFETPDSYTSKANLGDYERLQRLGSTEQTDSRFVHKYIIFNAVDASCCPSGGTLSIFYEIQRSPDSVKLVATQWEHNDEDGNVIGSGGQSAPRPAEFEITSVPSAAIHLPFNGSNRIAEAHQVRWFGKMLYGDGISGLAPDFQNPRTGNVFYKKHYVRFQPLTAREFTVSLWFNFEYNAHRHSASIYSVGSNTGRPGNTGFRLAISRDAKLSAVLVAEGETAGTQAVTVERNRWHFVTVVVSRDAISLYLDGAEVAATGVDFPFSFQDAPQYLGYHAWNAGQSGSSRFAGRIDELKLFSQSLADSQVSNLYASYRDSRMASRH